MVMAMMSSKPQCWTQHSRSQQPLPHAGTRPERITVSEESRRWLSSSQNRSFRHSCHDGELGVKSWVGHHHPSCQGPGSRSEECWASWSELPPASRILTHSCGTPHSVLRSSGNGCRALHRDSSPREHCLETAVPPALRFQGPCLTGRFPRPRHRQKSP